LTRFISLTRTIFRFAFKAELVPAEVRYGEEFKLPKKSVIRLDRREKGPRMMEAADLRKMLDAADAQMKAMILLGLNCGFGNTDCANLTRPMLADPPGWIDTVRE
jgi:hypothetical protein